MRVRDPPDAGRRGDGRATGWRRRPVRVMLRPSRARPAARDRPAAPPAGRAAPHLQPARIPMSAAARPSLTRRLAEYAVGLHYEDLPAADVKEAKRFLLDSVGCALAAVRNADMAAMYRFIRRQGGTPEATLIGSGERTNAANAALMNSLLIRALDYNDIFWEQDPSHPSDIIFAAISPAEARGLDGRDALVGIMIAYEL
ncbi:MmgE/PrpD family protein, partial [bacterium]|nr:MmgE/PrpD family protein [bacterium]